MTQSQQMLNLLDRYKVKTEPELIRAIADEYTLETCDPGDEPVSLEIAEIYLDRMLESEYQRIAGGAYDPGPPIYDQRCGCFGGMLDCSHEYRLD